MIRLVKRKTVLVAVFAAVVLAITEGFVVAEEPSSQKVEPQVEQKKFLVLDSRIIESTENAKLSIGKVKKHPANPLFGEDKPWECRLDNLYPDVIYDEQDRLYKCWYMSFIVDNSAKGMTLKQRREKPYNYPPDREMGFCYAVSKDGIHWKKPELSIVEFGGDRKNNILMREAGDGGGVFKDLRERDPARRYKIFWAGSQVAFSQDGLHWSRPLDIRQTVFGLIESEGPCKAFWAADLGKYVCIMRKDSPRGRLVTRSESPDFLHWTKSRLVLEGLERNLQTYTMPAFPYAGIYIGLLAIFNTETDRVHVELTWSPDTIEWHRISPDTPLIPCSEKVLDYDYGCVYACATPVFLKDEIRLYYGGSDWLHGNWRNGALCLATLRPDGFAGYEPASPAAPAVIMVKPVTGYFGTLRITADVQVGGSVRVTVVDEQGQQLAHGEPVSNTVTNGKIVWQAGWDVAAMSSENSRLKFELRHAKLYSFNFHN